MPDINVTERWHETFPEGRVGVLLIDRVDNAKRETPLDKRKWEVEAHLRETFAGYGRADFLDLDILKAYRDYYKQFGNTYHIQAQLESVVKGKSLPNVSPLVDANFAAELETLVLTAGHDADLLEPPITIDATQGGEAFTLLNGKEKQLKPNDMMMTDAKGIICTILYGQDNRTLISPRTQRALYVAYAPAGVSEEAVQRQLESIRDNIYLFAPEAEVELLDIFAAKVAQ